MIATAKRAQVRSSLEVLPFRYFLSIVVCPLSGPVAGVVFRPHPLGRTIIPQPGARPVENAPTREGAGAKCPKVAGKSA